MPQFMLTRPVSLAALIMYLATAGGVTAPSFAQPNPSGPSRTSSDQDEPDQPPKGNAAGMKVKTETEKSGAEKPAGDKSKPKPADDRDDRPGASGAPGVANPSSTANPSRDR